MTKKLQTILPVFCLRRSNSAARFEQSSASSPSPLGGTSRALCGSGSRTDQQFHRALVGCDRGKMICFTVRWSFSCGLTGTGGQAALRRAHVRTVTRARSPRPHCSPDSEERRSWPLQWLSSISEELSGVSLQPLPGRSTAAHAAKQYAVVALSAAEQLLCRAASWDPSRKGATKQGNAWGWTPRCCGCCSCSFRHEFSVPDMCMTTTMTRCNQSLTTNSTWAEHLGVRLPASPPLPSSIEKNCCQTSSLSQENELKKQRAT